jgi:hypothetical protein
MCLQVLTGRERRKEKKVRSEERGEKKEERSEKKAKMASLRPHTTPCGATTSL